MPLPKFGTSGEPILDMRNARVAAAEATLLADEHIAAHQLGITLDELRSQHWHTMNDPTDHAEKRGALALLRAGLLGREPLYHALSICGVHGWDDRTTFREPNAPRRTRGPRKRDAASKYQRLPKRGTQTAKSTFWPREPITHDRSKLSAHSTR